MIVVLSASDDDHVPPVLQKLEKRGAAVLWFDPRRFPADSSLVLDLDERGFSRKILCVDGRTIDLGAVRAIWLRRPNPVEAAPAVTDPQIREWVSRASSETLNGALDLLTCLW